MIVYSFQAAFAHFRDLDERINFVATKVVHLGDQLEGVNTPRERAAEAYRLMKFFSEFLEDLPLQSAMFNDPFRVSRTQFQFILPIVTCTLTGLIDGLLTCKE